MGNTKSKKQAGKATERSPSKPELSQPAKDTPRQAPPQNPSAKPSTPSSKGTGSKASQKEDGQAFSSKRLEEVFNKYKEEGEDEIGATGMERFCQDLEIDPEDVITLVIAYHLKAQQMGCFTKEEFMKGFEALGLDTLDKIKRHMAKFRAELDDATTFKNIYRFTFDFSKEPQQKCIDIEIAQVLIGLLLVDRYPLASSFLEFLKQQDSYKGLNVDQWTSLLEFCKTIDLNFANYDENGAWPCVLDEWVSWAKEKKEGEEGADASS
jgi:DCN1-like protein 4/5